MAKICLIPVIFGVCSLLPLAANGQSDAGNSGRAAMPDLSGALSAMDTAIADEEATGIDEYYLGRAVAANILALYEPYMKNTELTDYLNRICQTVAINSPQPEIFNGYHVLIFDSAELNAFATPGGHMLISRGLVEACTSEDILASAIAHEFAHILLKHGSSIIADMRLSDQLTGTADRAAGIAARENIAAARAALFRNAIDETVNMMMKSGYAQAQEFAADSAAMTLLAAAGYRPEALVDLLHILQQSPAAQKGGFFATHPSPADRIANAEKMRGRYTVPDTGAARESRFKNK